MRKAWMAVVFGAVAMIAAPSAQSRRVASPAGSSATEVGGRYDDRVGYVGGRWLEVRYGRPIKRGRDLFGLPDYADALNDGAPVWRAGANVSTRLRTEAPIVMGGKTIDPGEYTLFIDLQPKEWTLIVSTWAAQTTYDTNNKEALFGAYDYTPILALRTRRALRLTSRLWFFALHGDVRRGFVRITRGVGGLIHDCINPCLLAPRPFGS